MEVGKKIHDIRKSKKMSQAELAEKAGISLMSIRRYEKGDRAPNTEQLAKIAAALGVFVVDIVDNAYFDNLPMKEIDFINPNANPETLRARKLRNRMNAAFDRMNETGQQAAAERVEELSQIPAYQKANHGTTESE
ncbi:MAG: helix-turn-helix domain-containing protein [Clostridia bacterium]|nr:helix-turn-helix domain-containing protein [Clostridia bacterium]